MTNQKTISTLVGVDIQSGRRKGNSTRITNNAIERLFQGYQIDIEDHASNVPLNKHWLHRRIQARLHREFDCGPEFFEVTKQEGKILMKFK